MQAFPFTLFNFLAVAWLANGCNSESGSVTFVILCQSNPISIEKCTRLEDNLRNNVLSPVHVIVSQKDFDDDGDWAILPIIPQLSKLINYPPWVVFVNEWTAVDAKTLLTVLSVYNSSSETLIGRALYDPEPTIIHHFQPKTDFPFPLLATGVAMSLPLFKKLEKSLVSRGRQDAEFSIDASHELALYIYEQINGPQLTNCPRFCDKPTPGCATWVAIEPAHAPVPVSRIAFAVKTCKQYHKDRVPVVKTTWGSDAKHISYFSDAQDDSIPTTVVNIQNVAHGHCAKTREIIRMLKARFKKDPKLHWAVIADDDTILSVHRIQDILGVYNHSEALAIGERYGFNLQQDGGYNYLTGGSGVVLSRALLLEFGKNTCACPTASTPDDMYLFGICFKRMRWTMIHSPLFHQARPNDYSADYLAIGKPVSFHKHWMVDPEEVYNKWFRHHEDHSQPEHVEL